MPAIKYSVELEAFTGDEGVEYLKKILSSKVNEDLEKDDMYEIVRKCKGVPLFLKLVGANMNITYNKDNNHVQEALMIDGVDEERTVISIIDTTAKSLSQEAFDLFIFCSILGGEDIAVDLLEFWKKSSVTKRSLYEILKEMIARNLIERAEISKGKFEYRVHGMLCLGVKEILKKPSKLQLTKLKLNPDETLIETISILYEFYKDRNGVDRKMSQNERLIFIDYLLNTLKLDFDKINKLVEKKESDKADNLLRLFSELTYDLFDEIRESLMEHQAISDFFKMMTFITEDRPAAWLSWDTIYAMNPFGTKKFLTKTLHTLSSIYPALINIKPDVNNLKKISKDLIKNTSDDFWKDKDITPYLALVKINLAYALCWAGDNEAAREEIDSAENVLIQNREQNNRHKTHMAYCKRAQGDIAQRNGKLTFARNYHSEAIDLANKAYGEESYDMVKYIDALAWDDVLIGDYKKAKKKILASLDIIEKKAGIYDINYSLGILRLLSCWIAQTDELQKQRYTDKLLERIDRAASGGTLQRISECPELGKVARDLTRSIVSSFVKKQSVEINDSINKIFSNSDLSPHVRNEIHDILKNIAIIAGKKSENVIKDAINVSLEVYFPGALTNKD